MRQAFIIFLLLSYYHSSFAQHEINFKGNEFTMSPVDTAWVTDPVTGNKEMQVIPSHPVLMNGKRIYAADSLKSFPVFKSNDANSEKLCSYLFDNLKKYLDTLDDGNYILSINNAVIDNKGRLVYYEFGGIHKLITRTVFTTMISNKAVNNIGTMFDPNVNDSVKSIDHAADNSINDTTGNTGKAFSRMETTPTDAGIDLHIKNIINTAAQSL